MPRLRSLIPIPECPENPTPEQLAEHFRQIDECVLAGMEADRNEPTYAGYLRTATWAGVRYGALERAEWRCQLCNSKGPLHVHHRTYENVRNEKPADLTVLCAPCHAKFHDKD